MSEPRDECPELLDMEPAHRLDPERLFRYRFRRAVACAGLLESFAYKLIPYSLLKSFVLTFDPTWKYRLSPVRISPVTRTREMHSANMFHYERWRTTSIAKTGYVQGLNCSSCHQSEPVDTSGNSSTKTALPALLNRVVILKDTTKKTRPAGVDYGECEFFTYDYSSPGRSTSRTHSYHYQNPCPGGLCGNKQYVDKYSIVYRGAVEGYSASYSDVNIAALRAASITRLNAIMAQQAPRLLAAAVPSSRRLSIFRSAFELRELPKAVYQIERTLKAFVRDLSAIPKGIQNLIFEARFPQEIPKEYVGFWFGWKQIASDVKSLLEVPAKVAGEVNYLLLRRGKPTTFRRSAKLPGSCATTPGWTYNPAQLQNGSPIGEQLISTVTRHEDHHELRLVINATFDFPPVGVPALRKELFLKKLGVSPTATDLYNLIPWTWLLDWFSGLGNYVDLIDAINRADDLYNWGFLTGITRGKVVTQHNTKLQSLQQLRINGGTSDIETFQFYNHSSVLDYKLHIRKDIVEAFGVKSTLDMPSLTTYQQSIIGGIVLSRL